jgi:uncharacterized membrane protein YciS (DUF1049 family)
MDESKKYFAAGLVCIIGVMMMFTGLILYGVAQSQMDYLAGLSRNFASQHDKEVYNNLSSQVDYFLSSKTFGLFAAGIGSQLAIFGGHFTFELRKKIGVKQKELKHL